MKSRHAAALAFVGWYLMVPPAIGTDDTTWSFDTDAPLTLWTRTATFSSKQECEQAKEDMQPSATNRLGPTRFRCSVRCRLVPRRSRRRAQARHVRARSRRYCRGRARRRRRDRRVPGDDELPFQVQAQAITIAAGFF